jgi:hypothetical protein
MAKCLKDQMIAEQCNVEVVIEMDSLFAYNGPSVWSYVISDDNCCKKICHQLRIAALFPISLW